MSSLFRSLSWRLRKDTKKNEELNGHQLASEHAICLGKMEVPNDHGSELCLLAFLYLSKQNEHKSLKNNRVNIFADEETIYAYDISTNHLIMQYSLKQLTYIWIPPQKNHVFGLITTSVDAVSNKTHSYFTAFKLAERAKDFAIQLERIFCAYMKRVRDRVILTGASRLDPERSSHELRSSSTSSVSFDENLRRIPNTVEIDDKNITPIPHRSYSANRLTFCESALPNGSGSQHKASSSEDHSQSA